MADDPSRGGDAGREELILLPPGSPFDPASIEEDYRALARRCNFYFPDFDEFLTYWRRIEEPKLLAMARRDGRLTGLASFSAFTFPTKIFLGENRKLQIPMVQSALFGSSILGHFDARSASIIVERLFRDLRFDMVSLHDLPGGTGLSEALMHGRVGRLRNTSTRRTARRLIVLPDSYEGFFAGLRTSTAKAVRRDQKMFNSLSPAYQVITAPDDVPDFVRQAAAVSSLTQKVERGAGGVADTAATIDHMTGLARQGCLRAYLAQVDGRPVACAWGDVANGVFYFRETAYDPALARYSPGRAILLYIVADLIEAGARSFDFGVQDYAYKERFSNHAVEGATVQIARMSSPRGVLAVALHKSVDRLKLVADQLRSRRR